MGKQQTNKISLPVNEKTDSDRLGEKGAENMSEKKTERKGTFLLKKVGFGPF